MRLANLRGPLVACAFAGVLTLAIQAASPKDTAIVSALELNSGSQSLEAKITMAEKSRYTYFELDSPRRLVVDFHGLKNGLNFTRKRVGAAGVEQIRTSFFDSKGRKAIPPDRSVRIRGARRWPTDQRKDTTVRNTLGQTF